ncbi:MAG: cytosolic protein [Ignavibacteria bacterium]|nr:cytosolic protein [Ignavibacteria bacterium]
MKKLKLKDVSQFVEENIGTFHKKRIQSLDDLKLSKVLRRKNPYLFKAKYVLTADEIIKGIASAHISSNEEAIFGNWLEGLSIFIVSKVFNGRKSGITGIDFEFDKNKIRYIVAVKSGPNWANSRQLAEMKAGFRTAKITLRTSNSNMHVVAVNGCCYGKDNKPDKGEYYKYCGQRFWEFISGDSNLFTEIIEPLGYKAKEKNDEFQNSYAKMINIFIKEFTNGFCKRNGEIDWNKLIEFNSGAK